MYSFSNKKNIFLAMFITILMINIPSIRCSSQNIQYMIKDGDYAMYRCDIDNQIFYELINFTDIINTSNSENFQIVTCINQTVNPDPTNASDWSDYGFVNNNYINSYYINNINSTVIQPLYIIPFNVSLNLTLNDAGLTNLGYENKLKNTYNIDDSQITQQGFVFIATNFTVQMENLIYYSQNQYSGYAKGIYTIDYNKAGLLTYYDESYSQKMTDMMENGNSNYQEISYTLENSSVTVPTEKTKSNQIPGYFIGTLLICSIATVFYLIKKTTIRGKTL